MEAGSERRSPLATLGVVVRHVKERQVTAVKDG
jgi:hypothetical protein